MSILVYGAYGFTGRLIVEEALRRGLRPIIAGRNADRLARLAKSAGLEARVAALDDERKLAGILADIDLVIHAAGPFTATARPMGRACLASRTHYLDITGEIPVFEKLAAIDGRAKERGIMMLPGAGFDVVPSDCLAAHLKRRLPTGNRLDLAIGTDRGRLSRGTVRTMIRAVGVGGFEREHGAIVPREVGAFRLEVDFENGPVRVISIPWGDLSTAFHSTGIPNIRTYAAYPPLMREVASRLGPVRPLVRSAPVQAALHWVVGALVPEGPDEETRRTARSYVWGRLADDEGRAVTSRLKGPEGYALTAVTSVDIAIRALEGEARPGFQTPSRLFGPDYVLGLAGFDREDLD